MRTVYDLNITILYVARCSFATDDIPWYYLHMQGTRPIPGKDHPYAWNPEFLWQLLRRSKSYKRAVMTYGKDLVAEEDSEASLSFFNEVLGLGFLNLSFPEDSAERKKSLQFKVSVEDDDDRRIVSGASVYKHKFSTESSSACLNPSSPALQNFLKSYGDVLRYPIPPEIDKPNVDLLNLFWNLRPCSIVDSLYMDVVAQERSKWAYGPYFTFNSRTEDRPDPIEIPLFRMVHLNLEINTHFDNETIIRHAQKNLMEALAELRKNHPDGLLAGKRADIEKFENTEYQKACELYEDDCSDLVIGQIIFPSDSKRVLARLVHRNHGQNLLDGDSDHKESEIKEIQTSLGKSLRRAIKPYMDFFKR